MKVTHILYLFEQDYGDLVRTIPAYNLYSAKYIANKFHDTDHYSVKIVDVEDGCVVYTLGI